MEPQILLAQLRALIERAPDLESYSPASQEHQVWLGQAHAIVARWNKFESISFKSASDLLSIKYVRQNQIGRIFGIINRAIADLELQVPSDIEANFGVGDVYDFFKALNKVIASAEKSLFIIDPYLDESVFDHYLTSRQPDVKVRLLLMNKAEKLLPASQKYIDQYGQVLELRKSKKLHDRVIFIDGFVCWLIGQSINNAAKAKPTYIVQLPPDVVLAKLQNYESIWSSANAL